VGTTTRPDLVLLSLRASGVDIDNDVALPRVSGDSRAYGTGLVNDLVASCNFSSADLCFFDGPEGCFSLLL